MSSLQTESTRGPHHQTVPAENSGDTSSPARSDPLTDIEKLLEQSVAESTPIHLSAKNIAKNYFRGRHEVPVLKGVDLTIRKGEFLSIIGQSGSGKSTLLHLLGTLDAPSSGEIWLENERIDNVPNRQRDALRNRLFGMIFQFYHLLPELSVMGNVLAPLMIANTTFGYLRQRREFRRRGQELLELVGLEHRVKHKPRQLSGGEMQRTAIARALINQPEILLADEPTGNLDHETGTEILEILRTLNARQNLTIVMVTHDHAIAGQADRTVRLEAGTVVNV